MKILIVKTSAIGDVIHTLPALTALRRHYPQARIDWLVEEEAADIVRDHPALDRLLVSRRKQWLSRFKGGQRLAVLREIGGFLKELRSTDYDLLIDFQNLLKSSLWVALARADRKAGFGRGMEHAEMSYLFLNQRVPAVSMDLHAVERERRLLAALGVACPEPEFSLPVADEDHQRLTALLAESFAGSTRPLVAVNPMTTWPTKHWQEDKVAQLADLLAARGNRLVFTGGPADRSRIAEIASLMEHETLNLAGLTSLRELAALYRQAAVLVTTDTGPMHLAAAVGTPVVALFGPTAPWRTGPWGKRHQVVRLELPCSPCFKKHCPQGNGACMEGIEVAAVLAAVEKVTGRQEAGR